MIVQLGICNVKHEGREASVAQGRSGYEVY